MDDTRKTEPQKTLLNTDVQLYNYNGYWFFEPMLTVDLIESIRNLAVRPDDILVASFTKSGTTWMQEIVWQMLKQGGVKLPINDGNIENRFPMLEFRAPQISTPTLEDVAKRDSPRLMKTHMPYSCIPQGFTRGLGKVIYIAREPKDVCVSLYHFYRMLAPIQYRGTFEQLLEAFMNGEVVFGPWIDHVADFWERGNSSNMLLITYEQLQRDGLNTLRKIAEFLEVQLNEGQLLKVHQECSFKAMKENPDTNYTWWEKGGYTCKEESSFMRKGIVGDWVHYFSPEQATACDDKFKQQLARLGLTFT